MTNTLKYVGSDPTTDTGMANMTYVDTRAAAICVTNAYVDNQCSSQASSPQLATPSYCSTQSSSYATSSATNSSLANYEDASKLGAVSGMAKSDANSKVPLTQLTNAPVRGAASYIKIASWSSTTNNSSPGTGAYPTSNPLSSGAVNLGSFTLPDPGYKYSILVFGYVECQNTASAQTARYDLIVMADSTSGLTLGTPPSSSGGKIIAWGTSSPGWFGQSPGAWQACTPSTYGTNTFTGSHTIYLVAALGFGSGTINSSNYQNHLTFLQVPVP